MTQNDDVYFLSEETLKELYNISKLVINKDMNKALAINLLIMKLAQKVENMNNEITKKKLSGKEKKSVVLNVVKYVIKDIYSENIEEISALYDVFVEPALEGIISFSKLVHRKKWCCFF